MLAAISDILAVLRGLLLIASIIVLLYSYHNIPFRGFRIMTIAQVIWFLTWLTGECNWIEAYSIVHEILLMIVVTLWTVGIVSIYKAVSTHPAT